MRPITQWLWDVADERSGDWFVLPGTYWESQLPRLRAEFLQLQFDWKPLPDQKKGNRKGTLAVRWIDLSGQA